MIESNIVSDFEEKIVGFIFTGRSIIPNNEILSNRLNSVKKKLYTIGNFRCYHITKKENVASILKNGFKFDIEGTSCATDKKNIIGWYSDYLKTKDKEEFFIFEIFYKKMNLLNWKKHCPDALLEELFLDFVNKYFKNNASNLYRYYKYSNKFPQWVQPFIMAKIYIPKLNCIYLENIPTGAGRRLNQVNIFDLIDLHIKKACNIKDYI